MKNNDQYFQINIVSQFLQKLIDMKTPVKYFRN